MSQSLEVARVGPLFAPVSQPNGGFVVPKYPDESFVLDCLRKVRDDVKNAGNAQFSLHAASATFIKKQSQPLVKLDIPSLKKKLQVQYLADGDEYPGLFILVGEPKGGFEFDITSSEGGLVLVKVSDPHSSMNFGYFFSYLGWHIPKDRTGGWIDTDKDTASIFDRFYSSKDSEELSKSFVSGSGQLSLREGREVTPKNQETKLGVGSSGFSKAYFDEEEHDFFVDGFVPADDIFYPMRSYWTNGEQEGEAWFEMKVIAGCIVMAILDTAAPKGPATEFNTNRLCLCVLPEGKKPAVSEQSNKGYWVKKTPSESA